MKFKKPKLTQEEKKNPIQGAINKAKDLDQQNKYRVLNAMWKGIGPLKGFEEGYQEIRTNLEKIQEYQNNNKNFNIQKTKKQLLESWSTGIGIPKQQKIENQYYQRLIIEIFENLDNKNICEKNIKELLKDVKKSEDEMFLDLSYKLQLQKKPKQKV